MPLDPPPGPPTGPATDAVTGPETGPPTGPPTGPVTDAVTDLETGPVTGPVTGSLTGPVTGPVTADDLDEAVRLAIGTLRHAPAGSWDQRAGSLEWTCWETVEHLADDLFAYAAQLGLDIPPLDGYVPFALDKRSPEGPGNTIHADPGAGPAGLLQVLRSCGALLSAMVRTAPADARAYHGFGAADAEGSAAMGIVETLVHTHDLAEGFGLAWAPPAGICARVLARLFPDAPLDTDPWTTLLWATGRADLPGRPRLTAWRWYSAPR